MTYRKSLEPRKCIQVINDLQEEQFDNRPEDVSDRDLDVSVLTSIWKHPERLFIESDCSLLLATLCREIHLGNYTEPLLICKLMKKSAPENQNIDKIFEFLLMKILKNEKQRKIDLHVILDWLDTGDRGFVGDIIKERSYAILKLYFLCRNRKAKLECFSCGCIQKYFVDLYTESSSTRFMRALNSLITSRNLEFHPTLERLFKAMPEISTIEYFEYYIELLGELQNCSVIDKSNEKEIQRLVQLIGLLSELKLEDVPRACSELNKLIDFEKNNGFKKKSSLVESGLRNKLLPKIFDSITTTPSVKITLTRDSVPKMVELVARERYSNAQQAAVLFSPLQLLSRIYGEFEVWEKTWPIVKSRLDGLTMDTPQAPIVALYVVRLIYQNDPSILGVLVNHLENDYKNKTIEIQNRILILLEIMEKLADSNPSFHSFFKENRLRKRLIMDSEIDITLEYLNDFSPLELNQLLQQKPFSDSEFLVLVEKLKDTESMINSDAFWTSLLNRIDQNSMIFIENQLKILLKQDHRRFLHLRIKQLFEKLKTIELKEKSTDLKDKSMELLLLKFPNFLLELEDSQYILLPQNTTISLVSVLIFAFCTIFEGNESEISRQLRKLNSKISQIGTSDSDFPLGSIEKISEKIRQIPDQLDPVLLSKLFEAKPENANKKERILEVTAMLFEKLAADFQKRGDTTGKMPFCQICNLITEYVKKSAEEELIPNFQKFRSICERMMEGFTMWTERWNWLFVSQKIITILTGAKNKDENLFQALMSTLNKNQALVNKLQTKKGFLQLESM